MKPTIGFVGLSHLGICSAIAAAGKGFPVMSSDRKSDWSPALPPEPRLIEEWRDTEIKFGHLRDCHVIYISQDTPTDSNNRSDLSVIDEAIAFAKQQNTSVPIVLMSQVPPGYTRKHGLSYYQVETLIVGRAIERAKYPERIPLGCADPSAPLPPALAAFLDSFSCPVIKMGLESAELCKIALNCYLASSITTTNMLAEVCENVGADWRDIAPALRLDRRIGPHAYLTPGLGIAGGHIERDIETIRNFTRNALPRVWMDESDHRKHWPLRIIEGRCSDFFIGRDTSRTAIWGLTYKPDTDSCKNAPANLFRDYLAAHDPAICFKDHHPLSVLKGADELIILTPWPEYSTIAPADIAKVMHGNVVLDPYGVLDERKAKEAGLEYYTLGRAC